MFLSREAILAAKDFVCEEVDVPEWGGKVMIRGLTGAQRDRFEAESITGAGKHAKTNLINIRARLLSMAICNEEGKPLFTRTDVESLGQKSAAVLDRLFTVAQRLSGVADKDVEELANSFADGLSEDSISG